MRKLPPAGFTTASCNCSPLAPYAPSTATAHLSSAASRYDRPVKGRKINWLKAGFLESHLSLTVSPNYAKELTAGADKGVELDNIARKVGVKGIVNGMDTVEWDPSSDKYLDLKYNEKTVSAGGALNRTTVYCLF